MSNILLIEPDAVLARTYTQALRAAGHKVRHAVSAEQAVQLADAAVPDAVILSLELAGHNGIEFLYEFRSYDEWQTMPVIMLTNAHTVELLSDAVLREHLGVQAVLVRSQTSNEKLVHTLAHVLAPATESER